MTMRMYSIKDRLNGFTTPIPILDDEVAKRFFKDQMIGNPTMKNSPEDFELHYMGDFNTETGIFANINGETLLEKGINYGTGEANN